MSLLFAEGFEHFHPSIRNLGSYGPHVQAWNYCSGNQQVPNVFSFNETYPSDRQIIGPTYYQDYADDPDVLFAEGRKNGRCLQVPRKNVSGVGWSAAGVAAIGAVVKKSRTLITGVAIRLPGGGNPKIIATFGRSKERRSHQHGLETASMTPLGGCVWLERGGYADLEWYFNGQGSTYAQIFHNRNLNNGDWHFIEFATTVYTGVDGAPAGWAKAKLGSVMSVVSDIHTATPASNDESFINAVSIRVGYGDTPVHFDDFYICNDEGEANNDFLGSIFVRPMSPSHTGQLHEAYAVGADYRHEAVGPAFIGDDAALPDPLPTPEEEPYFEPWDKPTRSHLIIPREGGKQNFACTSVPFMSSNPRIHGVVATVIAQMPNPLLARAIFTPIKTVGGVTHSFFPVSSDMVSYAPSSHLLVMENPRANDAVIDEFDPDWSTDAVNNSEYGFQIDPVIEQLPIEEKWNPALTRYPASHDHTVDEGLGIEDWPSRHWEEPVSDGFSLESLGRWDWACEAYDGFMVYDETDRRRDSFCVAWSNMRMEAAILMPEEFMKGAFDFGDYARSDFVTLVEESFGVVDTSYHEWVEQLQSWFDPYDQAAQSWALSAMDNIGLAITDLFDNHFVVNDEMVATAQVRSNHEFIGETLYPDDEAGHAGILYIEDGFGLAADHHDGNWVENTTESVNLEPEILTRHWRFEWFMGICLGYWNIGVVEQPLESWEPYPPDVKNAEYQMDSSYQDFIDAYYADIEDDLQEMWLLGGGDPSLDFDSVRTADFGAFVFEGETVVDMVDVNGNSIIEGGV